MTSVEAATKYRKPCPICGRTIHPSEVPARLRHSFPCPSCGEWLMYDTSNLPIIGVLGLVAASLAAWNLGYRHATFVFIVVAGALLLWFFGIFLASILIPPQIKRFKTLTWFTYDNRYSTAIWTISFMASNLIMFSRGYQGTMFIFIGACISLLFGFLGNFLAGILIPPSLGHAKGEPFKSAGSLCLSDKSESDNKTNR